MFLDGCAFLTAVETLTGERPERAAESKQSFDYHDENGRLLYQVERIDLNVFKDGKRNKKFIQRRPDGNGGWISDLDGVRRVPYRLPELIEAAGNGNLIVIVEGERKVDLLWSWNVPATCNSGGYGSSKIWAEHARDYFQPGDKVVILPDNDKPGQDHANAVGASLKAVGAAVRVLDLPGLSLKEDVLDWAAVGGTAEQLHALIDRDAKPWKPSNGAYTDGEDGGTDGSLDREIKRLSKLTAVDYERQRITAAGKLGVRASVLDKLVKDVRPAETGQGRPLELPEPEPWPSLVEGAALIMELNAAIRKYVVLSESDALTAALWVLHTYCFDAFPCTPRLAIMAPEKRCGKTTLLDVIALLVRKALATSNISTAATFRTIEVARPTLLIDEADTFLGENEELRAILNSGHRAGGQVIRTVGDDFEARSFSTHCPVAIAQIGKLPDTLADRSIHISMKRRAPGEGVTRFRYGRAPELSEAAQMAARWVADNADAIRECEPVIPNAIFNRAADNWEPLLAIAEVAGGDLPARARQAALVACGVEEELSPRTMLLADIHDAFEEKGCSRMASADLVAALVAMTDRPWGECNHGKALTQNQLARRLKPFGVGPKTIRIDGDQLKGYELDVFSESFTRYIPAVQSVPPSHANKINELGENQSVPRAHGGTVQNQPKSLKSHDYNSGTVQNPPNGHLREKSKNSGMCDADDGHRYGLNGTISDAGGSDGWEDEI